MTAKHRKTLEAIFSKPPTKTIRFRDVESLLRGIGCAIMEGEGSRIRIRHDKMAWTTHRPHPGNEIKEYQVKLLREFLEKAGVRP